MLRRVSASPYRRPLRDPPRALRARSPWLRAGMSALLAATLPFAWSEGFTCDHAPRPPVTGAQILFGEHLGDPEPGLVFVALLVLAVGLGLAGRATFRVWRQLACDVLAGLAGSAITLMCVMMMRYGRDEQPLVYPAAWLGTLVAAAMAGEAWWAAAEALQRGLAERRAARGMAVETLPEREAAEKRREL